MVLGAAAAALALQLGMTAPTVQNETPNLVQVREGPCSYGYDIDVYGRCYPNGVIPPQYQAARQYPRYRDSYGYYEPRRAYRDQYRRRYYRDD
ncbi:hypothetical protein AB8Z38_06290 [Bradyrhizobium sp. LLZ17]|uniref:Uncharacterized protein n=1 Tax=Bradyrhizobium sp. LLZ17 TaxID=3239388 RepID=A0AB39XMR2_9BRAD